MRRQSGFTYLALLFAVALIGTSLGIVGQLWHMEMQREKEAQLLWVGNQYRQAIEQYWRAGQTRGGAGANPVGVGVPAAVTVQGGGVTGVGGTGGVGNNIPNDPNAQAGVNAVPAGIPGVAPVAGGNGLQAGAGAVGGAGPFPAKLEDLLSDPRFQQVRRYLRRLYPDPITGKADWVPIIGAGGGIVGVRSASEDHPIKQENFRPSDIAFTRKTRYADWAFIFVPPANSKRTTNAGGGYVQSPVGGTAGSPGIPGALQPAVQPPASDGGQSIP